MAGFRYLERSFVSVANPTLAPAAVPARARRPRVNTEAQAAVLARLAAAQRSRPRCPAGHEYAGENLYVRPDGRRMCRRCRANQAARLRLRKRLERLIS